MSVHVAQYFPSGIQILDQLLTFGAKGVQLFFIVSSLTMCLMWEKRQAEESPIRNFFVRRVLRIAPLFWLFIPIYLLFNGTGSSYWAPEGISYTDILLTFVFLHGFWPSSINSVVPGGWSIAVEMTFYFVFPLIILKIKNHRNLYLLIAIAIWAFNIFFFQDAASNFFTSHYSTESKTIVNDFLYLNFINQAPVFFVGCYLYYSLKARPKAIEILLIAIWIVISGFSSRFLSNSGFQFIATYIFLAAFSYTCIKINAKFWLLEMLGRHSYAMYLVHFLVISIINKNISTLNHPLIFILVFVTTITFSLIASKMIEIVIENPIQRFGKHLTH